MTVSDARVSGDSEGDCAGDAPTEISTIGDGGFRASLCLFWAPVVRHDAFYALLFCLAVRVYVYFSPRLSRGSTGWVGVGGGSCNPRHAPDVTSGTK